MSGAAIDAWQKLHGSSPESLWRNIISHPRYSVHSQVHGGLSLSLNCESEALFEEQLIFFWPSLPTRYLQFSLLTSPSHHHDRRPPSHLAHLSTPFDLPLPNACNIHMQLMPERAASAPSEASLHIYATRHTFRRKCLYATHNITSARVPIYPRHAECAVMES